MSVSSSDYEYSSSSSSGSSDEDEGPKYKQARTTKAPSPPRYYPNGLDEEEDIGSSDSDFEEESLNDRYDDLRDFIDFDPEFNQKVVSKKRESFSKSDDPLRDFLFNHDAKSRKWFRTFAWAAVGPKLTKAR